MSHQAGDGWRTDFVFEFWGGAAVPGKSIAAPDAYCHHFMTADNNTYQGVRTEDGLKYAPPPPTPLRWPCSTRSGTTAGAGVL